MTLDTFETFPSFKPRSEVICCHFSSISILTQEGQIYLHGQEGALLSLIMLTRVKGTVKTSEDNPHSSGSLRLSVSCETTLKFKPPYLVFAATISIYFLLILCLEKLLEILTQRRSLRLRGSKTC